MPSSTPARMTREDEGRMRAALDMVRRTGAQAVQIRWSEDPEPTIYMAVGEWLMGEHGEPVAKGTPGARPGFETAAGMTPLAAAERLLSETMDGGRCAHCQRPSGVEADWRQPVPWADRICWFIYDPELKKYRRSCEGET